MKTAAAQEFVAFGRRTARRSCTVGFNSRGNHGARPLEVSFRLDRELDPIRLMLAQRDPGVDLERLALAANPRLRQPDIECSVLIEMSNLTLADPQRRAGTERPLPERRSIDEIEARR